MDYGDLHKRIQDTFADRIAARAAFLRGAVIRYKELIKELNGRGSTEQTESKDS
jgi:hypothetical protein